MNLDSKVAQCGTRINLEHLGRRRPSFDGAGSLALDRGGVGFDEEGLTRDGAMVARWSHKPKVAGSSPAPATKRG